MKYCKFCGQQIDIDAVVCIKCGRQVEELKVNVNNNPPDNSCNKWVAFLLCFFLGAIGAHKFYEGKIGLGILYIFTLGLFGIGILVDLIVILGKPNYYPQNN